MTAANHGSEPILGTMNSDVDTMITPIAPPNQIHHGKLRGETTNSGGKRPNMNVSINKIAVPLPNEMSEACSG